MRKRLLKNQLRKYFNRQPGFWFYQIAGFSLFVLIDSFEYIPDFFENKLLLLKYFISFSIHFSITLLLRILYRYIYYRKRSILLYASTSIIVSIIAGFFWIVFKDLFSDWLKLPQSIRLSDALTGELTFIYFYRYWTYFTLLLFGWSALYFGIKFWMELSEEKKRSEKVSKLAQEAKLKMLRYQLNPHFLFNSLNSMQALMYHDTKLADKMLTQLSEFLRYSLVDDENIFVPLKNEIEIIEKYLSIEKIRFNEKLNYQIEVSKNALQEEILCFLLQPLVENAIKHGFKTSSRKLDLTISALKNNSILHIDVKNSGKWVQNKNNSGRGIENVKERLENAYLNDFTFNIEETDGWVIVSINITIRK
ncbi:sensor histidine kinase [Bacteroidota bacterium]